MTDGYGDAGALLPPLATRAPALMRALNAEFMARHIEEMLLRPGGQVHRVTPGALWYRPDGSCSLRYRVTVSTGTAGAGEHTVLARVYPSEDVAGPSIARDARLSAPATDPPFPWRRWSATEEPGGASLYLFPADPALPTLVAAMDLDALSGDGWPYATAEPTSVELVHHSRQGPAVLRYGIRRAGSSTTSPSGHVYGKVYPDTTTGQRVHRFLDHAPDLAEFEYRTHSATPPA